MTASRQHIDDDTLVLYVWEELSGEAQKRVLDHLRVCSHCRERAETLRRARTGLRLLVDESIEAPELDWARIRHSGRGSARRLWVIWPVAAALLLSLWLVFRSAPPGPGEKPSASPAAEFSVFHAELAGRQARVFVFTPNDSVTTIWLE